MRANALQLPGVGGMGAAGIDWCITPSYHAKKIVSLGNCNIDFIHLLFDMIQRLV